TPINGHTRSVPHKCPARSDHEAALPPDATPPPHGGDPPAPERRPETVGERACRSRYPCPKLLASAHPARWPVQAGGSPDRAVCGIGGRKGIWIWRDGGWPHPTPVAAQERATCCWRRLHKEHPKVQRSR